MIAAINKENWNMRRALSLAFASTILVTLATTGCAYTAMESYQGNLYVGRSGLFYGVGRNVYQCQPDGSGNITCVAMKGRP